VLETAQNSLPLLLSVSACLFVLYISSRSTPWALSRQLKGWDGRLDELERDWNRTRGDLAVGLEQLEQLDASVKKHRQKTTQERVQIELKEQQTGGTLHELRQKAGLI